MLDLVYDSGTIMIRVCHDQMIAFITLPLRNGSALKNIILIT